MKTSQTAILTKTLNLKWFGNKTINIEEGSVIQVTLRVGGCDVTGDNLETQFEGDSYWLGYHGGFYFRLKPEQFKLTGSVAA